MLDTLSLTTSDDPNIYSSESAQKPAHIQSDHDNCDYVSEPVIEIQIGEDLLVILDNLECIDLAVTLLEGDAILHDEYNPNVTDPIEIPIPHKENEPPYANEPMQDGNE